jgi:tetratricopeptide (TPR) repeat protein
MKNLLIFLTVLAVIGILFLTGCRPPELETVKIDFNQGRYEKAYELAKECVVKYPDNPEAWYLLGELHGRHENYVEMNEAFAKSLSISPQFENDIKICRGNLFSETFNNTLNNYYNPAAKVEDSGKKREMYKKAAEKFIEAHLIDPTRNEPLIPIAIAHLQINDTLTAEKYLSEAADMNAKNDSMLIVLGDYFKIIKNNEKAEELYKKAITVNDDNSDGHIALGELYAQEERWEEAIVEFNKGVKLQPNNPAITVNIGIIYYQTKKYEEAISYFKKTIEIGGGDQDVTEYLSLSYLQAAQKYHDLYSENEDPKYVEKYMALYDEALLFLEDAIVKYPNSAMLHNNLGVVYAQKGMKAEAEKMFQKQNELEGNQ